MCGVNEAWNWVGANPSPASGSLSDQTAVAAGLHQQFFQDATQTMAVGAGETLVAHVYLDPANPPSEIMIQWHDYTSGWEHRAYWGANLIGWGADGTNSRRYMGALPPAGQWVRLEVPAAAVGLEGQTVHGLALTLYNGRATWDKIGKGSVRWLVTDHLGTPRMTADQTGSLSGVKRHDYLPFGEEISDGIGGRTTQQGYGQLDAVRQKFTGYERDGETGLDFAQARYFSSTQGRFVSVDPGPFMLADPQSWNRYAYVQNNPLKFVDPTGETLVINGEDADYVVGELERITGYKLKRNKKTGVVTIDGRAKRKTKGTSTVSADKLKEITNRKEKTPVTLNTVRDADDPQVYIDSFPKRAFDVSDYNVLKEGEPEFAAAQLGHTIEEYYQAAKKYSQLSEREQRQRAHAEGLAFESLMIGESTGQAEQPRKDQPTTPTTTRYIYTSVQYDVEVKSSRGRLGYNTVTGVSKVQTTTKPKP